LIISIIVPIYKELTLFSSDSNVLSLLNLANTEVIICEALPTSDRMVLICQELGFKYVVSDVASRSVQMNLGAEHACGEVLVFLHADVKPPLSFLDSIRVAIKNKKDFGFFAYHFFPSSRWLDINAKFTHRDGFFAGGGDQIHFMTKSFFGLMNGYDETYCIMEDFEFTRRVKRLKISPEIIRTEATVSSRKYQNNSYLRVNLANLWAVILFYFGVKPEHIKQFYTHIIK